MTDVDDELTTRIRNQWARFVQSPPQLAFTRLCKFPPGSSRRLVEALGIQEGERVLDIGGGLGLLAGRLAESGRPRSVILADRSWEYLTTRLPEPLRPEGHVHHLQADGFDLPLPSGTIDRIVTHTLVNLFDRNEWTSLHEECRRVLTDSGEVVHMDGIGGDSWYPWELQLPEDERERRRRFYELLEEVHSELETGYVNTVRDMPQRLETAGLDTVNIDTYSAAFRLTNDHWSPQQRKLMLELWQRADRDRVVRLRNLLEATERMNSERGQLLRQRTSDVQQQALRRRKALENNRELGWRSSTTLIGRGRWS